MIGSGLFGWLRKLMPGGLSPSEERVEGPERWNVFMVTGDRELADAVNEVVRAMGHTFTSAPDPEGARASMRSESPTIMVLDWRLPTVNELRSLLNYEYDTTLSDFPGMAPLNYWTSTTFVYSASSADYIGFGNGYISNATKANNSNVRCVHDAW